MEPIEILLICQPILYEDIYNRFLVENRPFLLSSHFTESWPCRREWVNANGSLNLELLASRFGDSDVPVTDCDTQTGYGSARSAVKKFREYLGYLREPRMAPSGPCQYLKDWHFPRQFRDERSYEVPEYFSSDWLNEYCDSEGRDDYRFLYLGPAGSWTPLHEDVLQSFSWSANISGRKKWILFPPNEERKLRSGVGGQLPSDVTTMDLTAISHAVIVQEAGEILFVPGRWYHQVINLEDTLSINHNWINGANVESTGKLLLESKKRVEKEISDCRTDFADDAEWATQCEKILKADMGMNIADFKMMLRVILGHRRDSLTRCPDRSPHEWLLKRDIQVITDLLDLF